MKTELENPYLKDAEKYPDSLFIFRKVKGFNIFYGNKAKDFMRLKLKHVQFIKETLQEPNDKDISKMFKLVFGFNDFNKVKLLQFYKAYNYIVEQIKSINESEKALSSTPSERLIAAGIEKMSIFGVVNLTDDIAKRYGITPQEVENWTYDWFLTIALKSKYENDIQKNLENGH